MDPSTLVENQIDEGRRFVERFAVDGNPLQAAFWVETAEDGLWFLYVVTDLIDREGPASAYRAVNASLRKLGELWLTGSEIKVISPGDSVAKDVLSLMSRNTGRLATRFEGQTLGSIGVEQVYIYPAHLFTLTRPNPMTTEEIGQNIVRLMNRGPGLLHSSRVDLKDGTRFNGVSVIVASFNVFAIVYE